MKVMICGKGGSGKSTITVLLARILADRGYKVVIVDADESNTTLPRMLGVSTPRPLVEFLGGRSTLVDALRSKKETDLIQAIAKAKEGVRIDDLPPDYVGVKGNIKLIVIGKIREFGEGCACPLNFLTRAFLKNLILSKNMIVLVDTDAGVEHVGRGVEEAVDKILVVVDPTYESLMIAKTLKETASKLGRSFNIILNKVRENTLPILLDKARELQLPVDGWVSYDDELAMCSLQGTPLSSEKALKEIENILGRLGL